MVGVQVTCRFNGPIRIDINTQEPTELSPMTTNQPSTEIPAGTWPLAKGCIRLHLMYLHQKMSSYLRVNAAIDCV